MARDGMVEFQPIRTTDDAALRCLVCYKPFTGDGYRVTGLSQNVLGVIPPEASHDGDGAYFSCMGCSREFTEVCGELAADGTWTRERVAVCGVCGEAILEGEWIDVDFDVHGKCKKGGMSERDWGKG